MKLPFARKRSVKSSSTPQTGVVLVPGSSGSSVFFDALADAIKAFPGALGGVRLPSDKAAFKDAFPEVVLRFEAHRAGSPERVAIARTLVASLHDKLMFNDGVTSTPLASYLTRAHAPVELKVLGGRGAPAWSGEIPWRNETYAGVPALKTFVAAMHRDHLVTDAARAGLDWTLDHVAASGFDLRGQRFAMLGAGAELAPEQHLRDGTFDQASDGATHGSRAELWVKSFPHQKRQGGLVQFQLVTARSQEFDLTRQKLLRDLQLVFVAQAMEHELLVDACEDFRAQGLLGARENMPFQCRFIRVLQAHQFRRTDV